jgi:hypothetical protein
MTSFQFTLIVEGPDLQEPELIDSLLEAGCDDASVGRSDGIQYLDFDRRAPSLEAAIVSAVRDVEAVGRGVEVVRLADAGLVSMADIASRIGRTRESVRLLIAGERGPGGFPPPATDPRSRYRLWRWVDVERWVSSNLGLSGASRSDEVQTAISAGLEFRHYARHLDASERLELLRLVAADV